MSQGSGNDELGKIFVGGINRQTTEEGLRKHFEQYGQVADCILMKDKETGQSRGFGFVTYADPQCVAEVLKARPHTIDNKIVDPKPCTPRHVQQQKKQNISQFPRGHKIFIGGISMEATEEEVKSYFERYGNVLEVIFVPSKNDPTRPHKGFGFVTFEDESSVDQACAKHFHMIKDKRVEAKKAESRDKMDKQNDQQNQGYGNMGYGQQNMQAGMQGNMPNMGYQQGMNQPAQGWMGGQMMGNYGYGNQSFPTAYPQSYGNQSFGYGYGTPQGYGNMQQPQQPMGANMAGYGNMPPNQGMMGAPAPGMPNNQQNNGNMRGQGDMGNYQQNPSNYGPAKPDYSMGGGSSNMGMKNDYGGGNMNQMGGGSGSGYGPPSGGKQGGSSGYHPYRR